MGKDFTKPALSVAHQIALLKNKNMLISDESKAKQSLTHIGFYHLSAYWFPYKTGNGRFQNALDFNEIIALYEFDRALKLLIMDAIERIEISVRENFVNAISLKYGAHGYLNWQLYKTAAPLAKIIGDTNRELHKPANLFTQHYKNTYDSPTLPPLWIVAELLSFGTLSKFMADLKQPADRNAIARNYTLDESIFMPVLGHLSYVRNICAHHARLWNRALKIQQRIAQNPQKLNAALNNSANNKIYNALCYITYLLGIIAPQSAWKADIKDLVTARPPYADPAAMGFPPDWQNRPLWRQA